MATNPDPADLRALLDWQREMGADEAIGDRPVDRFALPERMPPAAGAASPAQPKAAAPPTLLPPESDPITAAEHAAGGAADLSALKAALEDYPHCALRQGAKQVVFSDGNPRARVMLIGEAPGRNEDALGKPFVGQAGQLLDRMLAAVGMARDHEDPARSLYITNVLPWRPPGNRDPEPAEVAMMVPFLRRHVELADPEVLVLMGNHSCTAILGKKGITKLRGQWTEGWGRKVLPMLHTAYLLRRPHEKRNAWADMLSLADRLGV